VSHVQTAHSPDTNDGAATTVTVTMGSAFTATNALAVKVTWQSPSVNDLTSVTDTSNTYTIIDRITVDAPNTIRMATAVAQNIAAGGPRTITANFSTSALFRRISCSEYDTVATTGQPNAHQINASAAFGTGTDAVTSNTGTTTVDGCTIWGAAYDDTSATIPSVGTSFTSRFSGTGAAGDANRIEDRVQSTQGAVAATFTTTAGTDSIGVAMLAFAPASGGGGGPAATIVPMYYQKKVFFNV
jgi:hypothetical protein